MDLKFSTEMRKKFLRFREVYDFTHARLRDEGASGHVIASQTYAAANREVTLTPAELRLCKMHVALHSVNGGELFSVEHEKE